MRLRLASRKHETVKNVETFYFEPDQPISWKAGQFLKYQLSLENPDNRGEKRFFTIASAPFEKYIQLTTRFTPNAGSSFKRALEDFKIGEEIEASGPMGHFSADNINHHFVFIAGGMGITPFRSILKDLDYRNKPLNVSLLYANRTTEILFREELEVLATKHSEFKIFYLISEQLIKEEQRMENIKLLQGKVSPEIIKRLMPNYKEAIYYISGPEEMVMDLEQKVWDMGISKERTNQDYFPGYEMI